MRTELAPSENILGFIFPPSSWNHRLSLRRARIYALFCVDLSRAFAVLAIEFVTDKRDCGRRKLATLEVRQNFHTKK
jgi:hypothetical protein